MQEEDFYLTDNVRGRSGVQTWTPWRQACHYNRLPAAVGLICLPTDTEWKRDSRRRAARIKIADKLKADPLRCRCKSETGFPRQVMYTIGRGPDSDRPIGRGLDSGGPRADRRQRRPSRTETENWGTDPRGEVTSTRVVRRTSADGIEYRPDTRSSAIPRRPSPKTVRGVLFTC